MGAFIAKQDIPWGGVNAYTRGQRIEADVVEAQGWQDFVAGENTKEGRQIKADVSGRPVSDFETTGTPARSAKSPGSDSATGTEQKG